MGVEVWAFAALVAVLAVYLFPFLVRRREMTGQSNIQDRYSAELRVLHTGATAAADGACGRGGHAELFRRRPEVKGMNRPAVRNVRALRTERELGRARKAHAQARERRRVAAAHRGVVACVLLGVSLGAWAVGALTVLPWWPALVPTALMGVSMVAGRRAAVASAEADRRERLRIAELERELTGLTGRRPTVPVVASKRPSRTQPQPEPQSHAQAPDFDDAVLSGQERDSIHVAPRFVQESFRVRAQEQGPVRSDAPSRSVRTGAAETGTANAGAGTGTAVRAAQAERTQREASEGEAPGGFDDGDDEVVAGDAVAATPARSVAQTSGGDADEESGSAEGVPTSGPSRAALPETVGTAASAIKAVGPGAASRGGTGAKPASRDRASSEDVKGRREFPTSTPPQGWRPVHVPAPTYTLAARAPRRAYEEPVVDQGGSAPVPARPHRVRTFAAPDFEERDFQPIDLDAVLERRRAAGE